MFRDGRSDLDVIRSSLQAGASINAIDDQGRTPEVLATMWDQHTAAHLLQT